MPPSKIKIKRAGEPCMHGSLALLRPSYHGEKSLSRGEIVLGLYCFLIVLGVDKPLPAVLQCPQISQAKRCGSKVTGCGGVTESGRWWKSRMSGPAKNPSKPKLKAQASRGGVSGGTLQPPGFDGEGPKNPEREANQVAPRSGGLRPEISERLPTTIGGASLCVPFSA